MPRSNHVAMQCSIGLNTTETMLHIKQGHNAMVMRQGSNAQQCNIVGTNDREESDVTP